LLSLPRTILPGTIAGPFGRLVVGTISILLFVRFGGNMLVLLSVSSKVTGIPIPFIASNGCIIGIADAVVGVTLLRVVALSIPPTVTVILFAAVLSSLTSVTAAVVINGMVIVTVLVVPVPVIDLDIVP
jgi:hypothetical protein